MNSQTNTGAHIYTVTGMHRQTDRHTDTPAHRKTDLNGQINTRKDKQNSVE